MREDSAAHTVIFWTGLASAALAVLFDLAIGLGVAGAPTRLLAVTASLLLALCFVTFASAVHSSSAPRQRVWTQIALSFSLLYAALLVWNYFLQLTVVRTNPTLYSWLSMDFSSASAFWALEVIGYALLGLAALFILPVVPRSRLGAVCRWSLYANAIFTIVGAIGYGATGNPMDVTVLTSLGVWSIAFPIGVALIAIASRQAIPEPADAI